jgi:hypothetical protein
MSLETGVEGHVAAGVYGGGADTESHSFPREKQESSLSAGTSGQSPSQPRAGRTQAPSPWASYILPLHLVSNLGKVKLYCRLSG